MCSDAFYLVCCDSVSIVILFVLFSVATLSDILLFLSYVSFEVFVIFECVCVVDVFIRCVGSLTVLYRFNLFRVDACCLVLVLSVVFGVVLT